MHLWGKVVVVFIHLRSHYVLGQDLTPTHPKADTDGRHPPTFNHNFFTAVKYFFCDFAWMPHTCINNHECKNNKPKLNKTKTTQSLLACNNIQIQNCRGSIHLEDLCATRYELFRVPHHSNNRLKWWQTACCSFWIKMATRHHEWWRVLLDHAWSYIWDQEATEASLFRLFTSFFRSFSLYLYFRSIEFVFYNLMAVTQYTWDSIGNRNGFWGLTH